ncbi:MAG: tetratricopeptide repeat protein [Rhodospirillaceae bacterium]|nr:tetratricopeptide repeat protein [Rhodospirillaceae bacterium]
MTASKDASKVPAPTKAKSKKPEKSDDELMLDGLMNEIEEDLREEEIAKLLKKYGNYILAVIAVIILSVVGWQLWKQNHEAQMSALTKQYEQAGKLVLEGKYDEALTSYATISEMHGEGLAALAQLQKAAVMLEKGDRAGAMAAYKALQNDSRADALFRDLAVVLYALHGIDTENPQQLEASLKPLLNPANPYRYSALELTSLLASKQGDQARALKVAEDILADQVAPQGVHQRAEELAAMFRLGVTAAPAAAVPATTPAPEKTTAAPSKP